MTLNAFTNGFSLKQITLFVTFALLMLDGINGFVGAAALLPFATRAYVNDTISAQLKETAETLQELNSRISNLQLMSIDMSLQQVDGQLASRRGELVDLRAKLIDKPIADIMINKRISEVEANIEELVIRRNILICYRDTLVGMKRDCR